MDFLIVKSGTLDGIYNKVVPNMVDRETFWCRYFYRVDKLKQQEKIRESLVKRAMSGEEDDDELSWDVDDEEDGHGINQEVLLKINTSGGDRDTRVTDESLLLAENQSALKEKLDGVKEETVVETETSAGSGVAEVVDESSTLSDGPNHLNAKLREEKEGATVLKDDHSKNETVVSSDTDAALDDGGKNRNIDANNESRGDVLQDKKEDESPVKKGSAENSDNVVEEKGMQTINSKEERENGSSHKEKEDTDELSWDEIEDTASDEEKKSSAAKHVGTTDRPALRKHLNVNEDDEDLSWDIEDDDEPVKS